MQKNIDIREKTKEAGVRLWQVAYEMGMCDSNFARLLRKELPEEKKRQIFAIIEELRRENQSRQRVASL